MKAVRKSCSESLIKKTSERNKASSHLILIGAGDLDQSEDFLSLLRSLGHVHEHAEAADAVREIEEEVDGEFDSRTQHSLGLV